VRSSRAFKRAARMGAQVCQHTSSAPMPPDFRRARRPGRRPAGGDRPAARIDRWMTRVTSPARRGTPPAVRSLRACHGCREGSPQVRHGGPGGRGPDSAPAVAPGSHVLVRRGPRAGGLWGPRRGLRRRARRCVPSGEQRVRTQHLPPRGTWPRRGASCVEACIPWPPHRATRQGAGQARRVRKRHLRAQTLA
jgi:hypothetical protein